MPKGYVYIMTSTIDGLIKIGKSKDWNRRCKDELESNGYKNANGLKTYFVAECEEYDEIENIMHDIFNESQVSNTELFAVNKDRARRVLSKMGKQVYPEIVEETNKDLNDSEIMYSNFWKYFINLYNKQKNKPFEITTDMHTTKLARFAIGDRKGYWLNIHVLKTKNIIYINFGTGNEDKRKELSSNYKNLIKDLPDGTIYESLDGQDRLLYYQNNFDMTNFSDKELLNIINAVITFYNVTDDFIKSI